MNGTESWFTALIFKAVHDGDLNRERQTGRTQMSDLAVVLM